MSEMRRFWADVVGLVAAAGAAVGGAAPPVNGHTEAGGSKGGGLAGTDAPVLKKIKITPKKSSFYVGAIQQYHAIGLYSDPKKKNIEKDITGSVDWASDKDAIVHVTPKGRHKGMAPGAARMQSEGTATITAKDPSSDTRDSLTITVKPAKAETATYDSGVDGKTPHMIIETLLSDWADSAEDYWMMYRDGIMSFMKDMLLAADEEAEPQAVIAALTAVGKDAFDAGFDAACVALGPSGAILKSARSVYDAWAADAESKAKAKGEVALREYLDTLISGIGPQEEKMENEINNAKSQFTKRYDELAKFDAEEGVAKPTPDGRVFGRGAKFIKEIEAAIAAFEKATPSANAFKQRFARAFAFTPDAPTDKVAPGDRAGKLHFRISLFNHNYKKWNLWHAAESWLLITKQANAPRVAQSLLNSLGEPEPWKIELEKVVEITVVRCNENDDMEEQETGWVCFGNDPDSCSYEGAGAGAAKLAWQQQITRDTVLGNKKLDGRTA